MAEEFCPRCGTARVGSFRYCRSCGFDFDAEGSSAPDATAPPTGKAASPLQPMGLGQLTVLSQAQSCLTPAAAFLGFLLGAGGWAIVIRGNDLGWAFGAIVAGLVVAWALGTWVQVYFGNKILRGLQGRKDPPRRR